MPTFPRFVEISKNKIISLLPWLPDDSPMPKPSGRVDDKERAIARRVREVRFFKQLSLPKFAKSLGVTPDKIAGIEYARTPLTVAVADKISSVHDISLIWLAHGKGRRGPCCGVVSLIRPEIKHSELLSRAIDDNFEKVAVQQSKFGMEAMAVIMGGEISFKNDKESAAFAEGVQEYFEELLLELPLKGNEKLLPLMLRTLSKFSTDWQLGNHKNPGENITMLIGASKKCLHTLTDSGNNAGVKAKLPELRKRLNEATSKRGLKTELAKFMGVPLSNVSQWLSGEREPGGETTLQLLQWVEQEERQK